MMIKKAIVFLLLSLPILSFAQGRGGRNISPDSMATYQTQSMTDSLTLSTAQSAKIFEVNLEFAQKMKETRVKMQGDWENMRPAMQALRKEQMTAWAKFLTDDQLARWQIMERARREKRRGNRPGGKRNRAEKPAPNDKTNENPNGKS